MASSPISTESNSSLERRGLWAFWIAFALAVAGVVAPLVLAGGSTRIYGSMIPYGVAAIALGACAILYHHGRVVATALYFVASLAVVFGILSALAVPLRTAVLGTCTADLSHCPVGLEQPITTAESTALGFVIGIGIVAILAGYFGVRTLFHRHRQQATATGPTTPPVRRIAPVGAKSGAETPPTTAAESYEAKTSREEAPAEPDPMAELPAPAAELELPAHEAQVDLPAHSTEDKSSASPAPERTTGRRRGPKAAPEPPTPTGSEP